jgi:hypothetical protein
MPVHSVISFDTAMGHGGHWRHSRASGIFSLPKNPFQQGSSLNAADITYN